MGSFAFVALVSDRGGDQQLIAIRPPETGTISILAEMRVGKVAALSGLGAPLFGQDDQPLAVPAPVYLAAANGTRTLYRLCIPPNPQTGDTVEVTPLQGPGVPVALVAAGSLAMLPADGSGVLYDPAFDVGRGGLSEPLFTIFGSSLELQPRTLNLSSRGNDVSGRIEVANGNAAAIDPSTLMLEVKGVNLAPSAGFAPQLDDVDGDGNPDLTVKFDRAAVQALIPSGENSILATAHWQFTDGSAGFASAEIGVVQQRRD